MVLSCHWQILGAAGNASLCAVSFNPWRLPLLFMTWFLPLAFSTYVYSSQKTVSITANDGKCTGPGLSSRQPLLLYLIPLSPPPSFSVFYFSILLPLIFSFTGTNTRTAVLCRPEGPRLLPPVIFKNLFLFHSVCRNSGRGGQMPWTFEANAFLFKGVFRNVAEDTFLSFPAHKFVNFVLGFSGRSLSLARLWSLGYILQGSLFPLLSLISLMAGPPTVIPTPVKASALNLAFRAYYNYQRLLIL